MYLHIYFSIQFGFTCRKFVGRQKESITFYGSHGIEPKEIELTFLELVSWSPWAVFIPIITSNVLNSLIFRHLCLGKNYSQRIFFCSQKAGVKCSY